jgi:hypothetical protein
MKTPRTRKDRPSDGVNGTLSGAGTQQAVVCEVCLKPIRAGRWGTKRLCSPAHRLLSWTVDALTTVLREYRADTTPNVGGCNLPVNVNFYVKTLDADSFDHVLKAKIVPGLQGVFNHLGLHVPTGAVGG